MSSLEDVLLSFELQCLKNWINIIEFQIELHMHIYAQNCLKSYRNYHHGKAFAQRRGYSLL